MEERAKILREGRAGKEGAILKLEEWGVWWQVASAPKILPQGCDRAGGGLGHADCNHAAAAEGICFGGLDEQLGRGRGEGDVEKTECREVELDGGVFDGRGEMGAEELEGEGGSWERGKVVARAEAAKLGDAGLISSPGGRGHS